LAIEDLAVAVSTLLVCDDAAKIEQLQALISSEPQLKYTGTVLSENAAKQVLELSPSVIWIELAPEPAKALTLLGELKEKYPALQYLVSYDKLQPDLVKSAMQLGAVEYIDPDSAKRLLPDAIERINQRLHAAIMGNAAVRQPVLTAPAQTNDLPAADDNYVPGAAAPSRQVSGVRGELSQLEGGPGMLPVWFLPATMLALVLVVIILYFSGHH
jgi:DNA-binding NarL/FixJ family response regulator